AGAHQARPLCRWHDRRYRKSRRGAGRALPPRRGRHERVARPSHRALIESMLRNCQPRGGILVRRVMSERPLPPDAEAPEQVEGAGKFVQAKRRGRWEYAGRPGNMRAAVILAIDAGEVILVEQYRVPLGKFCLELPAGLVGDETDGE